jgi:hypothetical protein
MPAIDLVALAAVLQYLVFGALTGRARGRYGVKAPAVTGHEGFERAYRVQMNTLELLVALLPALYVAGHYWSNAAVAGVGAVYLVGRALYARAYVRDPSTRALGFMLSAVPILLLWLAGAAGALIGLAG